MHSSPAKLPKYTVIFGTNQGIQSGPPVTHVHHFIIQPGTMTRSADLDIGMMLLCSSTEPQEIVDGVFLGTVHA